MGKTPQRKRKRCPFCRSLFWPDRRVAKRQWACTKPDCQRLRKRESQRRWRASHPAEDRARKFVAQIAEAKSTATPPLPQPKPSAMASFPWTELRDELSPEVYVSFVFLAKLAWRLARDERVAQATEFKQLLVKLSEGPARDELASRAPPDLASPA